MRTSIYFTMFLILVTANSLFAATCDTAGRFTVNTDGTITDSSTGLTWKKCLEGLSGNDCATGTAATKTWSQALALTDTVNGWRVPNIKELQSIVDETKVNPAIDTACFPTPAGTANIYVWSASPYAGNTTTSWVIDFKDGLFWNQVTQTTSINVRLVKP